MLGQTYSNESGRVVIDMSPKPLAKRMLAATKSKYPVDVPAVPTKVAPIPYLRTAATQRKAKSVL